MERAAPLAFHLCCFYLVPSELWVSLSRLVFRAGCGFRLYRFLIAMLSTLVFAALNAAEM